MEEQLKALRAEAEDEIARATTLQQVEDVRVRYLGRKGKVTLILRRMGTLSPDDRPRLGSLANEIKGRLSRQIEDRAKEIIAGEEVAAAEADVLDVTLPGYRPELGHRHPISITLRETKQVLIALGFDIASGPEAETDYYNFKALNFPNDHPARDTMDTLYLSESVVLRTHTSPVQIRTMEKQGPPVRIVSLGRCYRCDMPDASHSPVFHQVEGLMVDRDISFAHMKGVLAEFFHHMLGADYHVSLRPDYFPFTEPSAEVRVTCSCMGTGCSGCSNTGSREIGGCGMVDPEVLKVVNYDPEEYTGFAFGLGVDRIAMLKFGISDMRLFFENDLRFLSQF